MLKLSDKLKRKSDECENLKDKNDEIVDEANFSDRRFAYYFKTCNELFGKNVKLKKKVDKHKSYR